MVRTALLVIASVVSVAFAAPANIQGTNSTVAAVPDYVLAYAPYQYLFGEEEYFLSDIATHIQHVKPEFDFIPIADSVTLQTLNGVNSSAFLTSNDDVESKPEWLVSAYGKPDASDASGAPATIIVVDKGNGIVHAFYFNFFSFNYGPELEIFGIGVAHFGSHVGDWEHVMIRFNNRLPESIYLSAHSSGYSYTWDAVEKLENRPVSYIAEGSHANYATAGDQQYILPGFDLIEDHTDAGTLYDLTANYRGFNFDPATSTFTSIGGAGSGGEEQGAEGVDWLYWLGRWGDEQYPEDDDRQTCIFDQCLYVSGPTGPVDKELGRDEVCPEAPCKILETVEPIALDDDGILKQD